MESQFTFIDPKENDHKICEFDNLTINDDCENVSLTIDTNFTEIHSKTSDAYKTGCEFTNHNENELDLSFINMVTDFY